MKRFGLLACLPLIASLGMPHAAMAQTCDAFLQDLQTWVTTQPNGPGDYRISFTMATNRTDGQYVSFSEGQLLYHAPSSSGYFYLPAYFQGDMTQYFSDRRFDPHPVPNGFLNPWAPFNPDKTDKLRVNVSLGWSIFGSALGKTTFTLLSWGNGQSSLTPSCPAGLNGLMYGTISNTMYVMSLNKAFSPLIR